MPIFFISGPPAAGKTTLSIALLQRFQFGYHLPVDDLRNWVKGGLADSVPWTEETERQFQIAEAATCDLAKRYSTAGFAVTVDHCRNPKRLEVLIQAELDGFDVQKVLLMPELDVNLDRNLTRKNKPFDPSILEETIRFTNEAYRDEIPSGWLVIDNSKLTVLETVELILASG